MWWKTEEVSTTHRTVIPSFPLYRLANSNPMNRLSKSNTGAHDRIADADRRSNTQTHGIRKGKFLVPLNWPWVTLTLKLSTNFENSHCTRGLGISDQSCLYACRMGVGIVVRFENARVPWARQCTEDCLPSAPWDSENGRSWISSRSHADTIAPVIGSTHRVKMVFA